VAEARAEYTALREQSFALNIAQELGRVILEAKKMSDAAVEWLTDPLDPARFWLGPRAEECWVTVETLVPKDSGQGFYTRRERRLLSHWLGVVEGLTHGTVTRVETKHTDPRMLLLRAHESSLAAIDRATSLIMQSFELQSHLDASAKLNALGLAECDAELRRVFVTGLKLSEKSYLRMLEVLDAQAAEEALAEALAVPDEEE
jgi:hypothetical protein